jgi:post-segregation antitoxin (ccd killing protein)
MADDAARPAIDQSLVDEARARGVDVEILIDRTLRQEISSRRTPEQKEQAVRDADLLIADYNQRFDRDGGWVEAWRHWE